MINPKQTVTVNFNLETVKNAVRNIPVATRKMEITSDNDVLNLFSIHAGIGTLRYIELNVSIKSEGTRTTLDIEATDKLGAIDNSGEYSAGKRYIDDFLAILTELLSSTNIANRASQMRKTEDTTFKADSAVGVQVIRKVFGWIFAVFFFLIAFLTTNHTATNVSILIGLVLINKSIRNLFRRLSGRKSYIR